MTQVSPQAHHLQGDIELPRIHTNGISGWQAVHVFCGRQKPNPRSTPRIKRMRSESLIIRPIITHLQSHPCDVVEHRCKQPTQANSSYVSIYPFFYSSPFSASSSKLSSTINKTKFTSSPKHRTSNFTMSFLYRTTPVIRSAVRPSSRLFSTSIAQRKSITETAADAAKAVDRKVSDAAVSGIDKGGM